MFLLLLVCCVSSFFLYSFQHFFFQVLNPKVLIICRVFFCVFSCVCINVYLLYVLLFIIHIQCVFVDLNLIQILIFHHPNDGKLWRSFSSSSNVIYFIRQRHHVFVLFCFVFQLYFHLLC